MRGRIRATEGTDGSGSSSPSGRSRAGFRKGGRRTAAVMVRSSVKADDAKSVGKLGRGLSRRRDAARVECVEDFLVLGRRRVQRGGDRFRALAGRDELEVDRRVVEVDPGVAAGRIVAGVALGVLGEHAERQVRRIDDGVDVSVDAGPTADHDAASVRGRLVLVDGQHRQGSVELLGEVAEQKVRRYEIPERDVHVVSLGGTGRRSSATRKVSCRSRLLYSALQRGRDWVENRLALSAPTRRESPPAPNRSPIVVQPIGRSFSPGPAATARRGHRRRIPRAGTQPHRGGHAMFSSDCRARVTTPEPGEP